MEFKLVTKVNASANVVYSTWLDSDGHTKMTGGEAVASNQVGGEFTAWGDYISGKNLELKPNQLIKQTWRTAEFDASDEDSIVEILFKEIGGETELTLIHTNLPEDGEQYFQGWEEHYFEPMKTYFKEK